MDLLINWFLSSLAIFLTSKIVDGFELKDFKSAMIASVIVGLLNMTLRWVLLILTLPINILTLGLFTFVVNAIVLKVAARLMDSFMIKGWGPAMIGAVVLSLTNMILFALV
jgi:putative membrane protein